MELEEDLEMLGMETLLSDLWSGPAIMELTKLVLSLLMKSPSPIPANMLSMEETCKHELITVRGDTSLQTQTDLLRGGSSHQLVSRKSHVL